MATNGNVNHQEQYTDAAAAATADASSAASSSSNLSKDEVGWYFVEQYYNTLSKTPEKLHLFYGKKSQFVYGKEAEVAQVSVGRQNIQDRIKALELLDSKVRISNVDSQASFDNIVIQVIGETSAKGDEPKKFVQTFVLAQQPSGYFVLNDILRYVEEENDEEPTEPSADAGPVSMVAPVAAEPEAQAELEAPKSKEAIQDKAELDATAIDKKLEDVGATTKHSPAASGIDTPATPAELAVDAPAKTEAPVEASAAVEKTARDVTAEEAKKPEAPKEPAPTPVASRAPPPAPAEPEPPKGPPKPLTWASLAAAAAGPKPALPVHPKTATPPAVPSKAPAAAASSVPTAPSAPAAETTTPKEPGSEWQTAGADSKRQNRPQSISGPPQEKEGTLGYVKYVTEKVTDKDLKTHLSTFGEVVYFDINRTKNCAFIEFATPAAYQAALAANPHNVSGENIIVEARRPKSNAYGGSNYNPNRGSISGRGRGGFDGSRSGSQGTGRGGFGGGPTRGRGVGGAPRGRGVSSQVTNV